MVHWRAGCLESVQVRFGGGQLETCLRSIVPVERRHDDRQGAGCLPYFGREALSRISPALATPSLRTFSQPNTLAYRRPRVYRTPRDAASQFVRYGRVYDEWAMACLAAGR